MRTPLCDRFGIEYPIFAFSHCRDVVAAVSRAGGLGVLGAVAFSPEELERELAWIDAHVEGRPYGVDVVVPVRSAAADGGAGLDEAALERLLPERHRRFVDELLERYRVPPLPPGESPMRGLLAWSASAARSQVEVALAHPIRLLASALGPPPPAAVEQAHAAGVAVAALVGTAEQARRQVEAGVDLIVAQGTEAGGHTGEIASLVLVPEVVDAVAPTPVLAAGGIGCGRQMAAALALGAEGVWTGSLWLTVAEADTRPAVREKLLAASSRDTVRSRCFSGKPARQLRTAWTDAWEDPANPDPLPLPLQFLLCAEAQSRIFRYADRPESGARELAGMPVGQIVGRLDRVRPTRQVISELVDEFLEAVERLRGFVEAAQGSTSESA